MACAQRRRRRRAVNRALLVSPFTRISSPLLASIPSPSHNGFYIGPLFFHAYGIMYVLAVTAAILITRRRWAAQGGDPDLVYDVAKWGFPAGLIGGRIYFVDHDPGESPAALVGAVRDLAGRTRDLGRDRVGVAGGLVVLHRRLPREQIAVFMDAGAPALLVAQAIGRVGNYFNQELFGKPTSLPWGLQIAPQYRPPGFVQYATFQPTFLYEIIWNLALAAFLVWLGHHRKVRPPGLFALYVAGYSGFRIFEETLRIDYSQYILGMRLNFWIAADLLRRRA